MAVNSSPSHAAKENTMSRHSIAVSSLAIATLLAPLAAGAAEVFTPYLLVAGHQLVCSVVNVSEDKIAGSVQLITPPITPTNPFTLAPGEAAVVAGPFGIGGYCKITIVGPKKAVRANLCVVAPGQGCVATADAR
jgi:hypothetical protein